MMSRNCFRWWMAFPHCDANGSGAIADVPSGSRGIAPMIRRRIARRCVAVECNRFWPSATQNMAAVWACIVGWSSEPSAGTIGFAACVFAMTVALTSPKRSSVWLAP